MLDCYLEKYEKENLCLYKGCGKFKKKNKIMQTIYYQILVQKCKVQKIINNFGFI